jgi:membrane protease YdiL (CAAX protease family)
VRKRPLLSFFALTFGITWGLGACYMLFPDQLVALFGPISNTNPLFYLAVYAPSFSALVITACTSGGPGLRDLLRRLFRWRVGLRWYLIVFLGMPSLIVGSAAVTAWFSGEPVKLVSRDWQLALYGVVTSLLLDPGPLGEELGWRGFALPRLLQGRGALSASIILGLIWGVWHLPAFLIQGLPQNQLSLPAFLVGTAALSVLMTWVYQHTRESILIAVLIHWLFNLDYLPRGTMPVMAGILSMAALVVVAVSGPTRLSRRPQPPELNLAPLESLKASEVAR